jgi:broad specificity phosphatase PhoE
MSTKLLIVRHGESVWSMEGRVQGQADPQLSPLGCRQAQALAEALRERRLAAVYTSPLLRTHETARAICRPHALHPIVEPVLREVDLGTWQGRKVVDLEADSASGYRSWRRNPMALAPPGGETLDRAAARVVPTVMAMARAHTDAMIALVTHSIIGRVLLCHFLQTSLELVPRLKLKKASITTLRVQNDGAVLEALSDMAHLRSVATVKEEVPLG